jgi:hypothetical protein
MNRPDFVTDRHLQYLDKLRESGVTNMFGAAADLVKKFGLDRQTAKDILLYWMKTFGEPTR